MEPLTAIALGVGGYAIWKRMARGSRKGTVQLKPEYQPSYEWPNDLGAHFDWGQFRGARPELRGAPKNTILFVPGIDKITPEERALLLDVSERVNIPVDSLAAIISKESGFKANATYWKEEKDPKTGKKTGKKEAFAVGWIQLTNGAHLAGFATVADLERVRAMSGAEQLVAVAEPYFKRFKADDPKRFSPGHVYMLNFLPDDARKPLEFPVGDNRPEASAWRKKIYEMNSHFDAAKKGWFSIAEVRASIAAITRKARGRRITVDGKIITRPSSKAASVANVPLAPKVNKKDQSGPYREVYEFDGLAGGILLACVKAKKYVEPTWVSVTMPDGLIVEATADAVQGTIAVKNPPLIDELTPDVIAALSAEEKATLSKPSVFTSNWRLPVTYAEQVEIAKQLGAVSPTKEIWDQCFFKALTKADPRPELVKGKDGLPDGSMEQTNLHDQTLGNAKTTLFRDVGKGWILHPKLTVSGAVNYGWFEKSTQRPIQGVGTQHGPNHYDYSQTCVLVKRYAQRNGQKVDLLEEFEKQGIARRFLDVYRT